ncbi:CaiB/BaiF CoA transferase family protein [Sporobolomyces salmoneus]|uniref:CaiB/BaiF CoA transferase family protein n=1 Tax=Sporobolomyces salmoneus TaxID=183962 RepID=UPI0031732492
MNTLPLQGIRVLELAGLAPGPFAGMVLADFGADVVRVDRADAGFNVDVLTRGKRSIAVSLKTKEGISLLRKLLSPSGGNDDLWRADVLIDPFRPGVLERIGLDPKELIEANPKLIVARLTGFRREGPYSSMAGHDINYVALSGVLSMLGRKGDKPYFPANLLADFAGGGMIAVLGILAAVIERSRSGKGQIVEIDMVTGTRYISSFPLLMSNPYLNLPLWSQPRGENFLDGGAPWYDVYETKDGKFMSVGALENHFYTEFLSTLTRSLPSTFTLPAPSPSDQLERSTWPALKSFLTSAFLLKTRQEWTNIFLGTEACCVPVLSKEEVDSAGRGKDEPEVSLDEDEEARGGIPDPAPRLVRTPAGTEKAALEKVFLEPGRDTREILEQAGLGGEVDALSRAGAISQGDEPVKSKL